MNYLTISKMRSQNICVFETSIYNLQKDIHYNHVCNNKMLEKPKCFCQQGTQDICQWRIMQLLPTSVYKFVIISSPYILQDALLFEKTKVEKIYIICYHSLKKCGKNMNISLLIFNSQQENKNIIKKLKKYKKIGYLPWERGGGNMNKNLTF